MRLGYRHRARRCGAFTLVDLVITLVVVAFLLAMLLPALSRRKATSQLIRCTSNLKQIGMSFTTSALDQRKSYPATAPTNETRSDLALGHHLVCSFQELSNELVSPLLLACPADTRKPAIDFGPSFANTNISYFLSLNAEDGSPEWLLSGDRN
jgi:type II secretory pathway pseudopilin PulG